MKKIYLVIAGAFLILLVITSMLLSLGKKTTNTQKNSLFPTSIPGQGSTGQGSPGQQNQQDTNSSSQTGNGNSTDLSTFNPMETLDFKAAYVPTLNKIVVEKKTPQAEGSFYQWVNQNQLNEAVNKNKILFTDEKIIPTPSDSVHKLENKVKDFFQLMDDLNSIGKGTSRIPSIQPSVTNNPSPPVTNNSAPSQSPVANQSRVYYAQCGDLGSLPLPNGCTLCNAGCGPTTVSMIASSYLGNQYDPKTIVNMYKSNNYLLGCEGSRREDAYQLLNNLGLKTTDYFVFNAEKADTVVPQLKKYSDAGWTFVALARFCDDPKKDYCGHFFWITDIDNQNNIWAYDPYYGRYEIPYNENSRYPYPLYLKVFGVKR